MKFDCDGYNGARTYPETEGLLIWEGDNYAGGSYSRSEAHTKDWLHCRDIDRELLEQLKRVVGQNGYTYLAPDFEKFSWVKALKQPPKRSIGMCEIWYACTYMDENRDDVQFYSGADFPQAIEELKNSPGNHRSNGKTPIKGTGKVFQFVQFNRQNKKTGVMEHAIYYRPVYEVENGGARHEIAHPFKDDYILYESTCSYDDIDFYIGEEIH